jgi:hypothetical protein
MSDVKFWFDRKLDNPAGRAANGDPQEVMKGLHGQLDNRDARRSGLREMYNTPAPAGAFFMSNDHALFIRGTSGDIGKALDRDIAAGVERLVIQDEEVVDIRFFRHNEDRMKVTYLGVAAPTYWDGRVAHRTLNRDWRALGTWDCKGHHDRQMARWQRERDRDATLVAPMKCIAITLQMLKQEAARTKGIDGWV